MTQNSQLAMPGRVYNLLREHAAEQCGYITTRDAEDLGVDPHRLQKMKDRGVLTRVSRGIFRFDDVPASALDQYAEATLWPLEVKGVLSHATALDLHELCDINPTRIDVTVPPGFRTARDVPELLRLHRDEVDERDLTWHEGLPIVGVRRAILGAIDQDVGWTLIEQAIDTARRTGRLTARQADELRALQAADTQATVGA
jgi:predicted transcriptional regulator of viral defense system